MMSDKLNDANSALVDWNQAAQALADSEVEAWVKANPVFATTDPEEIKGRWVKSVVEWKRQMIIAVIEEALTPYELYYTREPYLEEVRTLTAEDINTLGIAEAVGRFCELDPGKFWFYADDFEMKFLRNPLALWCQELLSRGDIEPYINLIKAWGGQVKETASNNSLAIVSCPCAEEFDPADRCVKNAHLLLVAAMLKLIKEQTDIATQTELTKILSERYKHIFGMSDSTQQKVFSAAKTAMKKYDKFWSDDEDHA